MRVDVHVWGNTAFPPSMEVQRLGHVSFVLQIPEGNEVFLSWKHAWQGNISLGSEVAAPW